MIALTHHCKPTTMLHTKPAAARMATRMFRNCSGVGLAMPPASHGPASDLRALPGFEQHEQHEPVGEAGRFELLPEHVRALAEVLPAAQVQWDDLRRAEHLR